MRTSTTEAAQNCGRGNTKERAARVAESPRVPVDERRRRGGGRADEPPKLLHETAAPIEGAARIAGGDRGVSEPERCPIGGVTGTGGAPRPRGEFPWNIVTLSGEGTELFPEIGYPAVARWLEGEPLISNLPSPFEAELVLISREYAAFYARWDSPTHLAYGPALPVLSICSHLVHSPDLFPLTGTWLPDYKSHIPNSLAATHYARGWPPPFEAGHLLRRDFCIMQWLVSPGFTDHLRDYVIHHLARISQSWATFCPPPLTDEDTVRREHLVETSFWLGWAIKRLDQINPERRRLPGPTKQRIAHNDSPPRPAPSIEAYAEWRNLRPPWDSLDLGPERPEVPPRAKWLPHAPLLSTLGSPFEGELLLFVLEYGWIFRGDRPTGYVGRNRWVHRRLLNICFRIVASPDLYPLEGVWNPDYQPLLPNACKYSAVNTLALMGALRRFLPALRSFLRYQVSRISRFLDDGLPGVPPDEWVQARSAYEAELRWLACSLNWLRWKGGPPNRSPGRGWRQWIWR